jgi:hypothetical protein
LRGFPPVATPPAVPRKVILSSTTCVVRCRSASGSPATQRPSPLPRPAARPRGWGSPREPGGAPPPRPCHRHPASPHPRGQPARSDARSATTSPPPDTPSTSRPATAAESAAPTAGTRRPPAATSWHRRCRRARSSARITTPRMSASITTARRRASCRSRSSRSPLAPAHRRPRRRPPAGRLLRGLAPPRPTSRRPGTTKPPLARRLRIQSLVAGEGFEPPTFGL